MVSYYPSAYRQQGMTTQNGQIPTASQMHSWYAGSYHHPQSSQVVPTPPSYCMQDEQQVAWPHGAHPPHVFHQEFMDFSALPLQHVQQYQQHQHQHQHPHQTLPSPPITVSGSEISSPGAASGNVSPPNTAQNRPAPVRSPFEWIKKTGYQSQPNPGKTRTKDKYRVVYSDFQRMELEKEFSLINKYITIRRKAELATTLALSERQIKIWFQNRRAKERKQLKKKLEEVHKEDPTRHQQMQEYEKRMQQLQQTQQQATQMQLMQQQQIMQQANNASTNPVAINTYH